MYWEGGRTITPGQNASIYSKAGEVDTDGEMALKWPLWRHELPREEVTYPGKKVNTNGMGAIELFLLF